MINDITKRWLDSFAARPSACLLLTTDHDGDAGAMCIEYLAAQLLPRSTLVTYIEVDEDKSSIGIDDVRGLQKSLSLKADEQSLITRIYAITEANLLTEEAQNALLKVIEELPAHTTLILCDNGEQGLLDTVKSRCFTVNVLPISLVQAESYGRESGLSSDKINELYHLSEGRSGILRGLVEDDSTARDMISIAKTFLTASVFDRQAVLKKKDFDNRLFLQSLKLITKTGMRRAKDDKQMQRWKHSLKQVIQTEKYVNSNVNKKLALLELSTNV